MERSMNVPKNKKLKLTSEDHLSSKNYSIARWKSEGHVIRMQERHLCTQFTTGLFPVSKIENQPRHQETNGLKSKSYIVDYCSTIKNGVLSFLEKP